MSKFYRPCVFCENGKLTHEDHPLLKEGQTLECRECEGIGFWLTDAGMELVNFLNRLNGRK